MTGERVLVMAGGNGIASEVMNTIEKKVAKERVLSAIKSENEKEKNKELIADLETDTTDFFSIWGYSADDNNLKNNPPQEGDILFITHINAAVYMGTIYKVFESQALNYIWAGSNSWKYKILIKNVIRIFIPEPLNGSTNKGKKDIKDLCSKNIFAPEISQIKHIVKCYQNDDGLRTIIEKTDSRGNFQGSLYANIKQEDVLKNLNYYCCKSHFECIVKEV